VLCKLRNIVEGLVIGRLPRPHREGKIPEKAICFLQKTATITTDAGNTLHWADIERMSKSETKIAGLKPCAYNQKRVRV
jgi:hypothetical protein